MNAALCLGCALFFSFTHRAIEKVLRDGNVVIGNNPWHPSPVLRTPQDTVQIWEILENVVSLLCPVAQSPVSHFRALDKQVSTQVNNESYDKQKWHGQRTENICLKCVAPSHMPAHRHQGSETALDGCALLPQGGALADCRHCILYTGTASRAAEVLCPALHSHEAPLCTGILVHLRKTWFDMVFK